MRCAAIVTCGYLIVVATAGAAKPAALPGLTKVEIVVADPNATGYGTFQSHNQKVVSNQHGIFMAHLRSRNKPYTAQEWRVSRSTDGGKTFVSIFEATHATNPAVLETDAAGNLYLARPDFGDHNVYLYRFSPADDFAKPAISTVPGAAAGKYAMTYDAPRKQLYFFSHNNTFNVIGLDGKVRHTATLLKPGEKASVMYPLLSLATDGVLYAGWTTQKHGIYLYWDIHVMRSRDGGRTWERLDGTPLAIPFPCDHSGPAQRITLDDEFESHTWLSSMMAKDGKLHFAYMAQTTPGREHYVRYDLATGRQDHRIQPEFKGDDIALLNLDGFFVTRASLPNAPLYFVSRNARDSRIGCLASDDNGRTWYDYAVGEQPRTPYAIGGCRELTADGDIVGSFTEGQPDGQSEKMSPARVCFLKIRAGLATAHVETAEYREGRVTLHFGGLRGQPEQIRLGTDEPHWGPWQRFEQKSTATCAIRPTRFQLRSRLGVVSGPQPIAWR